jgi:hypothetical protein
LDASCGGGFFLSLCTPRCGNDASCPSGLHCDPATGLCGATARRGERTGTLCFGDPGVVCAGRCDINYGYCVEDCVIGQACGPTSAASGFCYAYDRSGAQIGDQGTCHLLCNCSSDCAGLGSGWTCGDAVDGTAAVFGFRGECTRPAAGAGDDAGVGVIDDPECAAAKASCAFGAVTACRGDGDCLGIERCQADGTYSACTCIDAGVERLDAGVSMDASSGDASPASRGGASDAGSGDASDAGSGDAGQLDAGKDAGRASNKHYRTDYGGLCSVTQVTAAPDACSPACGLLATALMLLLRRTQRWPQRRTRGGGCGGGPLV